MRIRFLLMLCLAISACGRIGYEDARSFSEGAANVELDVQEGAGGAAISTQELAPQDFSSQDLTTEDETQASGPVTVFDLQMNDFADTSDWALNDATVVSNRLQLYSGGYLAPASAFAHQQVPFSESVRIEIYFGIEMGDRDGASLILHSDASGASALGGQGGGMGYARAVTVAPSLALEFDIHQNSYDPNGNHIALVEDGQVETPLASFAPVFDIATAGLLHVWFDYDGSTGQVEVRFSQDAVRPSETDMTVGSVDLRERLGEQAYLGFTGASSAHQVAFLHVTATENE